MHYWPIMTICAMRRNFGQTRFIGGGFSDFGAWRIVLLDSCLPVPRAAGSAKKTLAQLDHALKTADGRHAW